MIETIVFSIIILIAAGGGFALGHLFTMRGIAHVQPSASSMPVVGSVIHERDPFEPDYDDEPSSQEDEDAGDMLSKMEGLGLDVSQLRAKISGTPMAFAGVKADTSFVPKPAPEEVAGTEPEPEIETEPETEIEEVASGDEA